MFAEYLKEKKKERGWTTEDLAIRSGVPTGTINKILRGETKSPRYETIQALEDVFNKEDERDLFIKETAACPYGRDDKVYTLTDYYAFPEDVRVELIDGRVFYMDAPSTRHQRSLTPLLVQSYLYIQQKGGDCEPIVSPVDVQLDCDEYTMVQPDFLIVCDKNKITEKLIYGAPDFVVEILSPSTRFKDLDTKLRKYMAAGVREYWIVDLERERVLCYFRDAGMIPVVYTMEQEIPVRIFDGELKIQF